MAFKEYYLGSHGPFYVEDTDPAYADPGQVVIKSEVADYLEPSDIADDLITNDATKILSAKQGKVLKDLLDVLTERKDWIQLINKTGAASVKGTVVAIDGTVDQAVKKIVVDQPGPIGVITEDGIADGASVWVAVGGKAQVLFIGDTTCGHIARGFIGADAGYIAGYALSEAYPTPPAASDKHFYEIGHVIESRVGAGLAWCVLHFN